MKLHETPTGFTQSSSLLGDALDPRSEHGRRCFARSPCKLEDGFLHKPFSLHDQTFWPAEMPEERGRGGWWLMLS